MATLVEPFMMDALVTRPDRDDRAAADALFTTLYTELHRLARRELGRQQGAGYLGATTLLHESYLRISGGAGTAFPDRARFMAYASRVMRGLIIDAVRGRFTQKRGGGIDHAPLDAELVPNADDPRILEQISDALDALAQHDPSLAELVDMRFFCGFSVAEIAALRGVSEGTVKRSWTKSRLYLLHALSQAGTCA